MAFVKLRFVDTNDNLVSRVIRGAELGSPRRRGRPNGRDARPLERVLLRDLGIDKHLSSRAWRLAFRRPGLESPWRIGENRVELLAGNGEIIEVFDRAAILGARGVRAAIRPARWRIFKTPRAMRSMSAPAPTSICASSVSNSSSGNSARRCARDDRCLSMPRSRNSTRSKSRPSGLLGFSSTGLPL